VQFAPCANAQGHNDQESLAANQPPRCPLEDPQNPSSSLFSVKFSCS